MKPTPPGTHDATDGPARAGLSFGPRRYFVPVCVKTPLGFIGGPSGYCEVSKDDLPEGPIVEESCMDTARERAQRKQRARGNAPEDTRKTDDVRCDDLAYYRTGPMYRKWAKLPRELRK